MNSTITKYIQTLDQNIEQQSTQAEALRRQLEALQTQIEADKARAAQAKSLLRSIESVLGEVAALAKDMEEIDHEMVSEFSAELVGAIGVEPSAIASPPEEPKVSKQDSPTEEVDDQTLIDASSIFAQLNQVLAPAPHSEPPKDEVLVLPTETEKEPTESTHDLEEPAHVEQQVIVGPHVEYNPTTLETFIGFNSDTTARTWGNWLKTKYQSCQYNVSDNPLHLTDYTHELRLQGLTEEHILSLSDEITVAEGTPAPPEPEMIDAGPQIKYEPDTLTTLIGFPTKRLAQAWQKWFDSQHLTSDVELIKCDKSNALFPESDYKWLLKTLGLSKVELDRLATGEIDFLPEPATSEEYEQICQMIKYFPKSGIACIGFERESVAIDWTHQFEATFELAQIDIVTPSKRFDDFRYEVLIRPMDPLEVETLTSIMNRQPQEEPEPEFSYTERKLEVGKAEEGQVIRVEDQEGLWRICCVSNDGAVIRVEPIDGGEYCSFNTTDCYLIIEEDEDTNQLGASTYQPSAPAVAALKMLEPGEARVGQIVLIDDRIDSSDTQWKITEVTPTGGAIRIESLKTREWKVVPTNTAWLAEEEPENQATVVEPPKPEIKVKVNKREDFPEGATVSISSNRFYGQYTGLTGTVLPDDNQFAAKVRLETGETKTFLFTELKPVVEAA